MSNSILPSLPGLAYNIHKRPTFRTRIQKSVGGWETRIAQMMYPVWEFELPYEFLRAGGAYTELQTLMGFYLQRQDSFDSFLYSDPADNSVTAQQFGSGDGATMAFQLARSYGGFAEPVQNLNGAPSVYVGGALLPATIAVPAAPMLSQVASGALAATTYYAKVTYVDVNGGETLVSAESSLALSANNLLTVASPAATPGVVSYNVYVSTTTGAETRQNASSVAMGTNWTEPAGGLVSGAALPSSNTTGYSISSTGLVTFGKAPATSAALTWTGSYYYRVRFAEDNADFNNMMQNLWELKKLNFLGSTMNKV